MNYARLIGTCFVALSLLAASASATVLFQDEFDGPGFDPAWASIVGTPVLGSGVVYLDGNDQVVMKTPQYNFSTLAPNAGDYMQYLVKTDYIDPRWDVRMVEVDSGKESNFDARGGETNYHNYLNIWGPAVDPNTGVALVSDPIMRWTLTRLHAGAMSMTVELSTDGGSSWAYSNNTGAVAVLGDVEFWLVGRSPGEVKHDYARVTLNEDALAISAYLPGDANLDTVVSADDYASVQANFGNTGAAGGGLLGDANHDGLVSADDYASVQANFGNTSGGMSAVPEPATLGLLAIGLIAVLRRRTK